MNGCDLMLRSLPMRLEVKVFGKPLMRQTALPAIYIFGLLKSITVRLLKRIVLMIGRLHLQA